MNIIPFDALYPAESRFDEIEKIIAFIKEGNSCQVVGIPGVGRSNLLGFLAYNKAIRERHLGEDEKLFHFVMINFSELRKRPLFDVTKIFFLALVDSLKSEELQGAYQTTRKIFKESLGYQDELILFQGLKQTIDILANQHNLTIVFLFERFEEYIPMLTPDFFTNLRLLRSRAKYHFSVVFSLNRPLEELIEPTTLADFYEFIVGHTIYLPISDAPGNTFRIQYLETAIGKTIDQKAINEITTYTAGHGKLTRICMEIFLAVIASETKQSREEQLRAPSTGFPRDLTVARNDVPGIEFFLAQKRVQGALYEIWYALSPLEQTCLASDNPCDHSEPTYLEFVGICTNRTIAIPLLTMFAKEQATITSEKKQHIQYNPETNTITKGNLVLSDTLTVSEFRLLHYLLEHQDIIIEKEEIIKAVWQDAKTTAGVTDQAVDQLLFRLRKKIEDDPNIPAHVQTVKGRGIKFTP